MKQVEDRFNHWAGYDYVFLNDDVSTVHAQRAARVMGAARTVGIGQLELTDRTFQTSSSGTFATYNAGSLLSSLGDAAHADALQIYPVHHKVQMLLWQD
jgi:hypothetical protein